MNNKIVSVIVPFFNEEASLPHFIEAINQLTSKLSFKIEIIFVNDGSRDNSVQLITSKEKLFAAKLVTLSRNFGSHAAARAGLQTASGDTCMFFSADLQDPVAMINELFSEIEQGYDIIAAQRKSISVGIFRKIFSRCYGWLIRKYAVRNYPDRGVDLIIFNSKVKDHLNKNIESNSSVFLQILNLGFKIKFIEYAKQARKFGKSKWTLSRKIKLLIDSFVAFSFAPIRMVSIVGVAFFIVGLGWTSLIIVRKLIYNDLLAGWPMLISILLLGFGITNISLGIIAEYLWRTLDASRKRPVFIIDEIIEL